MRIQRKGTQMSPIRKKFQTAWEKTIPNSADLWGKRKQAQKRRKRGIPAQNSNTAIHTDTTQ
jgi:hypothetical protein